MGVDLGAKSHIYALLKDSARQGTAVIVTSTDMEEVSRICHPAIVLFAIFAALRTNTFAALLNFQLLASS